MKYWAFRGNEKSRECGVKGGVCWVFGLGAQGSMNSSLRVLESYGFLGLESEFRVWKFRAIFPQTKGSTLEANPAALNRSLLPEDP